LDNLWLSECCSIGQK